MPVITLLTDFGLADTYVGQVKGAILARAPDAVLVDLTHAVPPQDIVAGAFLLWSAVGVFAPGSVHLAVVDPGVGSPRRAVALQSARGDFFVGPDNGLLIPAATRLGGIHATVELTLPSTASRTFHGRDVFGPAAATLAIGTPLEQLGSPVSDLVQLALSRPGDTIGEVIHVDTYGNLVTNFEPPDVPTNFTVEIGEYEVPFAPFYAAVELGALMALIGSAGLLEISARDASAAVLTGARRGTRVRLRPRQRPPE